MRFTSLAAVVAAAAVVSAQDTVVSVGLSAPLGPPQIFVFTPNSITAKNGSVVTFRFEGTPGNHSVTQSSFPNPCEPLAGGFDSGNVFKPSNSSDNAAPTWNLTITNDAKPIWFYCKQNVPSSHCNSGMVGVINVQPGANNLAAFVSAAQSNSLVQSQGGLVGVGASASADVSIPSGLTSASLFKGTPAPTGTAPAGSGASGGASGASSSGGPAPTGGATTLGVSLGAAVVGALAGAALL